MYGTAFLIYTIYKTGMKILYWNCRNIVLVKGKTIRHKKSSNYLSSYIELAETNCERTAINRPGDLLANQNFQRSEFEKHKP